MDQARFADIAGEAIRNGNMVAFYGDVSIGGNLNADARASTRGSAGCTSGSSYPESLLRSHTDAYVEPAWFHDALRTLLACRVIVLSGPAGSGREAAAFALLERALTSTGSPKIFPLGAEVLGHQLWAVEERDSGYLVPNSSSGSDRRGGRPAADTIDDEWLTRTRERLQAAGCFLVVVTGRVGGRLGEAAKKAEHVVDQIAPPEPLAVLHAKLKAADLRVPLAEVLERLDRAGVSDLLAERPRPAYATSVCAAVVTAVNSGTDLAEVLVSLRDPWGQVAEWFDGVDSPVETTFAVATAVLEGCGYLRVADAAMLLRRALGGGREDADQGFHRSLRAGHTWIRLDRTSAGEVVRFRNSQLGPVVLRHTWTESDALRSAIQGWLHTMVGHADVEVRARAATAAGLLASVDFAYATDYLRDWALGDSAAERQSAALALGVAGLNPELAGEVWRLLRDYAWRSGKAMAQTAAMTAGGPLGEADPKRAISLMRTLLGAKDWAVVPQVAFAFGRLVDSGATVLVGQALWSWSGDYDRPDFTIKALTAFTSAARARRVPAGASAEQRRWPALLRHSAELHVELPELWARALAERKVRKLALTVLRSWVRAADADATAYPALLDVLAGIADLGVCEADDLLDQLAAWATDHRDPSRAAAEAHDDLLDAEEDFR